MSFFKMCKSDTADRLFSVYIRRLAKWTCARCGRVWPAGSAGLTNSHFFSRAMESVRFDVENCDALCMFPCHNEWENEKGETKGVHDGAKVVFPRAYRAWKLNRLGPDRFARLEVRAHQIVRKDRKMALIQIKALLRDLDAQEKVIGGRP